MDLEGNSAEETTESSSELKAAAADSQENWIIGLAEMLFPGTSCLMIFNGIQPAVENEHHGLRLYEPLVGVLIIGFLVSITGCFYSMINRRRGRPRAEAEEVKRKCLMAGWFSTMVAFFLRISLHLSGDSLLKVALTVVLGSVPMVFFVSFA